MEGNLGFKINWASLIVGRKFTVFALSYSVFEGNFQVQAPGGLIFGGAYFRNFTVSRQISTSLESSSIHNFESNNFVTRHKLVIIVTKYIR